MPTFKKIIAWTAIALIVLFACFTNLKGFLFLGNIILIAIILPIGKWQETLRTVVKKPIKKVAIILAIILMIASLPNILGNEKSTTSDVDLLISQIEDGKTQEPSTEGAELNTGDVESNTHAHEFAAATCILPQKCSCGEISGAALGHLYLNGDCTVCGEKDPDYKPPQTGDITYVLNTKSKKFHLPTCGRLPVDNREDTTKSRQEIIDEKYEPCKICNP